MGDTCLVILFPAESRTPQLARVPSGDGFAGAIRNLPAANVVKSMSFNKNKSYLLLVGHSVEVSVTCDFRFDGSTANKSLYCTLQADKEAPVVWKGKVVVGACLWKKYPVDVTMSDLRHALDYLEWDWYAPSTCNNILTQIMGVRVRRELLVKGEDERCQLAPISDYDPVRGLIRKVAGTISPISEKLGIPLRVARHEGDCLMLGIGREGHRPATYLMRRFKETDVRAGIYLPGTCEDKWDDAASIHIVRADDNDLSIHELDSIVHFCRVMCAGVFEEAQAVCMNSGSDCDVAAAAVKKALGFFSRDSYYQAFV